jgi:hypothetical protein
MEKKYYDDNQCVYCGVYENSDPADEWGWFGVDEDADKVCPRCERKLRKLKRKNNEQ